MVLDYYLHLSHYLLLQKKIKMAIYIKSTLLKLEKQLKNIPEILFILCVLNILNSRG